MEEHLIVILAGIGLIGITCQWLGWLAKLPGILFLLFAGMIAGPVTGWLDPEAIFGDLLFPMVSLAVAVILFEGGLSLKLDEIRGLGQVVRNLVSVGVFVTWVITALATYLVLQFSWELSLLFGAIAVVTGPTVIVPMLRTVRPNASIANILRWEGIVIDPVGATLSVLVFGFIISGKDSSAFGQTFISFGLIVFVGLLFGAVAGYFFGQALRRYWLPEYLHNVATLAIVLGVFVAANAVHHEAGLLAVTVMGMWLANMEDVPVEEILDFKESLSVLLISVLFIVLAARIEFSEILRLGWPAVIVFLVIQFVARPAKVFVSTIGSSLSWQERVLLGFIAPRGIVAAAISALFAIRLDDAGFEEANLLVPLTFMVIVGTVVLQSLTARPLANLLGVSEPEPKGFLVIGATVVSRTIAKVLTDKGYRAILADTNWDNISKARMDGLQTYYGNPISEHADRQLDLVGVGNLLALSPQKDINMLSSLRYRAEFGRNRIFSLQTESQKSASEKHRAALEFRGTTLFGEDVTYSSLRDMINGDAETKSTLITKSFDFKAYMDEHDGKAIPLFAIGPKGSLKIFTLGETFEPGDGWSVTSLVPANS